MIVGKGAWAQFGREKRGLHFWIVLAEAGDKVLVVNLTDIHSSKRKNYDPACVFHAGEYRIVTKKSYIFYARANLKTKKSVLKRRLRTIDPKMFARVIAGAKNSKYFPPKYKHLI